MNRFGWMAEELTSMEEALDAPPLQPYAGALRRALQRAFVEACKASRAMRHNEEMKAPGGSNPQTRKPRLRNAGVLATAR